MIKFKVYWKSLSSEEKTLLSERSGVAWSYLSNIANGHRKAGRETINRLIQAESDLSFEMFISSETKKAS
jgi:hypothetical protein